MGAVAVRRVEWTVGRAADWRPEPAVCARMAAVWGRRWDGGPFKLDVLAFTLWSAWRDRGGLPCALLGGEPWELLVERLEAEVEAHGWL